MRGVSMAGTAIKNRRRNRRAQGKKVLLPFLDQPTSGQMSVKAVKQPTVYGQQLSANNHISAKFFATESAFNVVSKTGFTVMPWQALVPGNSLLFPTLSVKSSQYQYYKWSSIKITYTPSCGTNTAGKVYMAVVPNSETVAAITSASALMALAGSQQFPAWTTDKPSLTVNPEMLTTQYNNQTIAETDQIAVGDPSQTVGILIIAVEGFDYDVVPENDTVGKIMVTYGVSCNKPKNNPMANVTSNGMEEPISVTSSNPFPEELDWVREHNDQVYRITRTAVDAATFSCKTDTPILVYYTFTSTDQHVWMNATSGTATLLEDFTETITAPATHGLVHKLWYVVPGANGLITMNFQVVYIDGPMRFFFTKVARDHVHADPFVQPF